MAFQHVGSQTLPARRQGLDFQRGFVDRPLAKRRSGLSLGPHTQEGWQNDQLHGEPNEDADGREQAEQANGLQIAVPKRQQPDCGRRGG